MEISIVSSSTGMMIFIQTTKKSDEKNRHGKKDEATTGGGFMNLAKLQYFTNLDFPEIREFPLLFTTFCGNSQPAGKVAIICPE